MKKKNFKIKYVIYLSIFLLLVIGAVISLHYVLSPPTLGRINNDLEKWNGTIGNSFSGGNGSLDNPFLISNGQELAYFKKVIENDSEYNNKYFVLNSDIDMNNVEFETISNPFTGNFNGHGHAIFNLNITSNTNLFGLFSSLDNATIENLNIEVASITPNEDSVSGIISATSSNSIFKNISVITANIINANEAGILSGQDDSSIINNVYLNGSITTSQINNIGSAFGSKTGNGQITNLISKVLINSSYSNASFGTNNYISNDIYLWNNIGFANNSTQLGIEALISNLNSQNYNWQNEAGNLVAQNVVNNSQESLVNVPDSLEIHETGVEGNIVYVNDFLETYNYYLGLNYTLITSGDLPTYQNRYNENNLVPVIISYSGIDFNDSSLVGHISPTESETQFVYYQYWPIENGKINIELIDNPFSARPTGKGFNGWATNYEGAVLSYDSTTYTRYLTLSVSDTSPITINMSAIWTDANIQSGSGNKTQLYDAGMKNFMEIVYDMNKETYTEFTSGSTYYELTTLSRNQQYEYTGDAFYTATANNTTTNFTRRTSTWKCNSTTCYVYYKTSDTVYDSTKDYYFISGYNNRHSNATFTTRNESYTDFIARYSLPNNFNFTGYYYKVNIGSDDSSLYYNAQGQSCTTVSCSNNNTYKLIQNNDSYRIAESLDNYYTLVTRDINILIVNASTSLSSFMTTKPFTLTASYDGSTIPSGNTLTSSTNSKVSASNDLVIENVYMSGSSSATSVSSVTTGGYTFNGAGYNVKIGRNVFNSNGSQYDLFTSVYGSYQGSGGTAANPKKYKLIVETGTYGALATAAASDRSTTAYYIAGIMVTGNDYDRTKNNNENLTVYFNALASYSGSYNNTDKTVASSTIIVKSGRYGVDYSGGNYSYSEEQNYGIYTGSRGYGTTNSLRKLIVIGGDINVINGGPCVATNLATNSIGTYILGGYVNVVFGGAATTTTYGNRIVSVTGGVIGYSVFGGSNAYDGSNGEGKLSADTLVYVGGNAQIGSEGSTQAGDISGTGIGNVFAGGNGNDKSSSIGGCNNTNLIIDGNPVILDSIYGGSNAGRVGDNNTQDSKSIIKLYNGNINGSIYGSGNNDGSGSTNSPIEVDIYLYGGNVTGSVYGGANSLGTVYGNTNINVYNANVKESIYGGGKGGYESSSKSGTYVTGNVNVTIGNDSSSPVINGSVYGGSAFGTVNDSSKDSTGSTQTTQVNINSGIIVKNIFGGGEGNSDFTPVVAGNITVNINGGSFANAFGGCDAAGIPLGDVIVNLNGGTGLSAYGGGNKVGVNHPIVNISNGTYNEIYGGSYQAGDVTNPVVNFYNGNVNRIFGGSNTSDGTVNESNVNYYSNNVNYVYGGNNQKGTITNAIVNINGGNITWVFGGNRSGGLAVTTNVHINDGIIESVFGGGNEAPATTTNINLKGGYVNAVYGGSNNSGDVGESNITTNYSNSKNPYDAQYIYGGNNVGGITDISNITITNGQFSAIFGGGNEAVTNSANVIMNGGIANNVYGGGNLANITGNSIVNITNAEIKNSVYGGGNEGKINQNATLNIKNSYIHDSVYGGGKGSDASIVLNATTTISGTTRVLRNVFAGGNHGPIGEEGSHVVATLNIISGTILGSVYGGCNTNVVYGVTNTNIGLAATELTDLTEDDLLIGGTVFGGGEANEAGDEEYDFSFISVTDGIDILIDGSGYTNNGKKFELQGSIFGSGNASSSSGESNIYIKNLGTRLKPNPNISIQRATNVILDNSVMELSGTTDRTNEYSNIKYSINRVDVFKIKNNSVLLAQENANMLLSFYSLVDIDGVEEKAAVTINPETHNYTSNVDNRLYLLANKNLNITTNEAATSYGVVSGMTFLGMYTKSNAGSFQYGMYGQEFTNNSDADAGDMIIGGSYVIGLHSLNHDITEDGFYSNYLNDDYTKVTTNYVDPSPDDAAHYIWLIGSNAIKYNVSLIASKYSSLGTYELALRDFPQGDTLFEIVGFNSEGLASGIDLIDSRNIRKIANTEEEANRYIGLAMKAETTEWTGYGTTKFLSANHGSFTGDTKYRNDSQNAIPSLMFYLYHAKNMSLDDDLGSVVITLQSQVPINEIEFEIQLITITVNIEARSYNDGDAYDASITYSRKYEMPSATNVNITNRSQFTTYYSLFAQPENVETIYGTSNNNYHVLVSNSALPVGTKITMIDYGVSDISPQYYYYIIDEDSYSQKLGELATNGEVEYRLSDFIKMGSLTSTNKYNDSLSQTLYYNEEINTIFEEFLFIIDFEDTTNTGSSLNNSLLFELRNPEGYCLISVLGIRQSLMSYNTYESSNITLSQELTSEDEYITSGTNKIFNYTTSVNYDNTLNREQIIDTNYESNNMGINISFYDATGNAISSSLLEDTYIQIDGNIHHADSNGLYKIKLTNKVANIIKNLTIHAGNSLPSGTYTMRLKLFASSDGLYSNENMESIYETTITIISDNNYIIVDANEGESIVYEDNIGTISFKIHNYSNLPDSNIRITAYKRNIDTSQTNEYTEVDIALLFTNSFTLPSALSYRNTTPYEKILARRVEDDLNIRYNVNSGITSGTYKLVFKLFNADYQIDQVEKYIIVRKNIEQ